MPESCLIACRAPNFRLDWIARIFFSGVGICCVAPHPLRANLLSHRLSGQINGQLTQEKSKAKLKSESQASPPSTGSQVPENSLYKSIKSTLIGQHTLGLSPTHSFAGQWSVERDQEYSGQERVLNSSAQISYLGVQKRSNFELGIGKNLSKITDQRALPLGQQVDENTSRDQKSIRWIDTQLAFLQGTFSISSTLDANGRLDHSEVDNRGLVNLENATTRPTRYSGVSAGLKKKLDLIDFVRLDLSYKTDTSASKPEVYSSVLTWAKSLTREWLVTTGAGMDQLHTRSAIAGQEGLKKNEQRSLQGRLEFSGTYPEQTFQIGLRKSIERRSLSNNLYDAETISGSWQKFFRNDSQNLTLNLSKSREKDLVFSDSTKPQIVTTYGADYGVAVWASVVSQKTSGQGKDGTRPVHLFVDRLSIGGRVEDLVNESLTTVRQSIFVSYLLQI